MFRLTALILGRTVTFAMVSLALLVSMLVNAAGDKDPSTGVVTAVCGCVFWLAYIFDAPLIRWLKAKPA